MSIDMNLRRFTTSLYPNVFIFALIFSVDAFAVTTLKLAHVAHPTSSIGIGAQRFADNLHYITEGQMAVEIVPRGVFGGIPDTFVQMQTGGVDMQTIDLMAISLLNQGHEFKVLVTPYLFRDQQHLRSFVSSELFSDLMDPVRKETGIRYLNLVAERSPRVVSTTNTAVKNVTDLKGVKIRVPPHPVFIAVFKAWGANPTPVKPTDMYMALKSGMVDGEDNGVMNLVAGSNTQVIKHFTPINWLRMGVAAWISERRWQSFSQQERDWVNAAAKLSSEQAASSYDDELATAMRKLTEFGITVHEPEMAGFMSITDTIVQQFEGQDWSTGLVKKIQDLP